MIHSLELRRRQAAINRPHSGAKSQGPRIRKRTAPSDGGYRSPPGESHRPTPRSGYGLGHGRQGAPADRGEGRPGLAGERGAVTRPGRGEGGTLRGRGLGKG
jgi:hypothetical protein